jgi:hypothetical protein
MLKINADETFLLFAQADSLRYRFFLAAVLNNKIYAAGGSGGGIDGPGGPPE